MSSTTAAAASGFTVGTWLVAVLFVVVGPDHDQQHWCHHAPTVNPEAATAVVELMMMGVRTPEIC
jgi:hypothetical protein